MWEGQANPDQKGIVKIFKNLGLEGWLENAHKAQGRIFAKSQGIN
jgi:hypothetical protein